MKLAIAVAAVLLTVVVQAGPGNELTQEEINKMDELLQAGDIIKQCQAEVAIKKVKLGILKRGTAAFVKQRFQQGRISRRSRLALKTTTKFFECVFTKIIKEVGLDADKKKIAWLANLKKEKNLVSKKADAFKVLTFFRNSELCPPSKRKEISCPSKTQTDRTFDGTCNNVAHPEYGSADRAFTRILEPQYEDGCSETRLTSDSGAVLPNAREVSLRLYELSDSGDVDRRFTHMVMQWGQFLDHDLTLAPLASEEKPEPVVCCAEDSEEFTDQENVNFRQINIDRFLGAEDCASFLIPTDDPAFNRSCHPLVRSAAAIEDHCLLGPREQFNVLTAFVDGSQVYGANEETANGLKLGKSGLLKTRIVDGFSKAFLPERQGEEGQEPQCEFGAETNTPVCFLAGDVRANEHPGLSAIHTVFVREHNRIASYFASRTDWNDERIFDTTRKIVIAQIQMITYNEFLTVLLSKKNLKKYNLRITSRNRYFKDYNPKTDAAIHNEFAAAAYRLGHTLIRNTFSRESSGKTFADLVLSRHFENVGESFNTAAGGLDAVAVGLTRDAVQGYDRLAATGVRDQLFSNFGESGLDLFGMNDQRGRDHGCRSYVSYRRECGLRTPDDIMDLRDHTREAKEALRDAYGNDIDSIDMFAGGISETRHRDDGLAGPTFQCIIGMQMQKAREGDRFWFENEDLLTAESGDQPQFTLRQLREIRKRGTLAAILCRNVEGLDNVQPRVFRRASGKNRLRPCDRIESIDLEEFCPVTSD